MLLSLINLKDAAITATLIVPIITLAANFLDNLLNIEVTIDRNKDRETLLYQPHQHTFDFIIVGGGSAGCVLANRLTENPSIKVLLLDAGGVPTQIQKIPSIAYFLNNQKSIDWAYRTVPQSHAAFALNYNVSFWPAGKTLGGSSAIHGMINVRGNIQGFDLIAERTGDPLWKMKNVLKYYQRVEKYKGLFNPRVHGLTGQMSVEDQDVAPFTFNVLRAGQEMGYRIRDPNSLGPNTEGFAPIEFYESFGRRADAYSSHIEPYLSIRPNLLVRKFSFVTRLLFNNDGRDVYGVEYDRHGLRFSARATKEVILSTGALSTPKILMLSGIGPADHLKRHGIQVRMDLPVGLKLGDKVGATVGPFLINPGSGFNPNRDVNLSSTFNWLTTGRGMIGNGGTSATWVINTKQSKNSGLSYYPDIHTYVLGTSSVRNGLSLFSHCFNFKESATNFIGKVSDTGMDSFFQLVTLNRLYGHGHVRLRSKNPYSPLIIDPKYFQNPKDIAALVEGIRFSVDLVEKTKAFKEINGKLLPIHFPGCEEHKFKSDKYYECLARHSTITAYKYCGTAPMGRNTADPDAVVDSKFRVFGIGRLRVIDGSLFKISDLNTNDVTVRMIAEIGSDVLKWHWKI